MSLGCAPVSQVTRTLDGRVALALVPLRSVSWIVLPETASILPRKRAGVPAFCANAPPEREIPAARARSMRLFVICSLLRQAEPPPGQTNVPARNSKVTGNTFMRVGDQPSVAPGAFNHAGGLASTTYPSVGRRTIIRIAGRNANLISNHSAKFSIVAPPILS